MTRKPREQRERGARESRAVPRRVPRPPPATACSSRGRSQASAVPVGHGSAPSYLQLRGGHIFHCSVFVFERRLGGGEEEKEREKGEIPVGLAVGRGRVGR